MRSRGIAWESYEESETIYSVIIIINKAGRLETYIYIDIYMQEEVREIDIKIYRRSERTNNIIII